MFYCDLLDHLRSHILELIFQIDFLGHRHTVFGDGGGSKGLLQYDISPFGTQGNLHASASMFTPRNIALRASWSNFISFAIGNTLHFFIYIYLDRSGFPSMTPKMSSSLMIRCSSPSILTSDPEYFPKRILSPALTSMGDQLSLFGHFPFPTQSLFLLVVSLRSIRNNDSAFGFLLFLESFAITLSCNGLIFMCYISFLFVSFCYVRRYLGQWKEKLAISRIKN